MIVGEVPGTVLATGEHVHDRGQIGLHCLILPVLKEYDLLATFLISMPMFNV